MNFVDHGGPGLLAMPVGDYLYAPDLLAAFQTMHDRGMYKSLTMYTEACESGSMFTALPNSTAIYATSASSPDESSWGTYCPPIYVDGKEMGTCLGDLYSVNWMENTDEVGTQKETLQTQFEVVRNETNMSTVMQWGATNFTSDYLCVFMGGCNDNGARTFVDAASHSNSSGGDSASELAAAKARTVSSRHASLASLQARVQSATGALKLRLQAELAASQLSVDRMTRVFSHVSRELFRTEDVEVVLAPRAHAPLSLEGWTDAHWACYKRAIGTVNEHCGQLDDYSMRFLRVLALGCETYAPLARNSLDPELQSGAGFVAHTVENACTSV